MVRHKYKNQYRLKMGLDCELKFKLSKMRRDCEYKFKLGQSHLFCITDTLINPFIEIEFVRSEQLECVRLNNHNDLSIN